MSGSYEKGFLSSLNAVSVEAPSPLMLPTRYPRRSLRQPFLVLLSLAVVLLYLQPLSMPQGLRQAPKTDPSDIFNQTLGFEKIFVVSFAERTDKRDTMVLASSFTGFDFEYSPGVAFEDISAKAAPANWDYDKRSDGALGCWRAHMNVLSHIVKNRIHSALILEDDADFDINLKSQLASFAQGARSLQSLPSHPSSSLNNARRKSIPASPYGPSWDMLWIGHCKLGPKEDQQDIYVLPDDPTVPPIPRRHSRWMNDFVPVQLEEGNKTRVVFRATNGGLCTYSYAVTYDGARKMLAAVSVHPQNDAVDLSYRKLCQGRLGVGVNCLGVYPPLIGVHRAAGPNSRDSDLNDKTPGWHREYSWDINYSAKQNVLQLSGGTQSVKAQFSEVEPQSCTIGDSKKLQGRLETWDWQALGRREVRGINRN